MAKALATKYDPSEFEDKIYDFWQENKYFHAEPDETKKLFEVKDDNGIATYHVYCMENVMKRDNQYPVNVRQILFMVTDGADSDATETETGHTVSDVVTLIQERLGEGFVDESGNTITFTEAIQNNNELIQEVDNVQGQAHMLVPL